jgi:hypothetical protein
LNSIVSNDQRSPFQEKIKFRLLLSIGFLSAAIIAFQFALMQVLSIVQWYHFAYLVISVALLGFGAAGTVLAIFRQRLLKHINLLLPVLMISCGITMAWAMDISQCPFIRFDSYLLFANYSHIGRLLLTYLLFFIPFFLGALAIGLIFDNYVAAIGKIYFANLLGSGVGGLLVLALIWLFFPNQLPALISILAVIAGTIMIPANYYKQKRKDTDISSIPNSKFTKSKIWLSTFAIVAFAICAWKIIVPPQLLLSQFKDLSKTLLLPDAAIKMEKTSPYGLVQTVTSPVLRYAPGLSLTAQQTVDVKSAVFINGDWLGVVTGSDTSHILNYTSFALPYSMSQRNDVLVLRAGTAMEVAHAFSNKAKKIVAVESNAILLSILTNELAHDNDSLFYNAAIKIRKLEPRTFLQIDTSHYDLISLPVVGSFGGSAGLYALHEQFLLTKEAFIEMWSRLKDGGSISITAWMDYPARQPLKLLATLVEVLEELKIQQPKNHIAAIRSWNTISFVMTKSALTEKEISGIRNFCKRMQFDPALLPGLLPEERTTIHQLQDSSFFINMDKLFSAERKDLYASYDFNIIPATDNRPYFAQFIRWKSLPHLAEYFGNRSIPFFEIGYLLVVITLVQIAIISVVLILLPLFKLRWKGKNKFRVLLYFSGIGLGYMFVEMVFIQRFILYFGQPVYAASAVITSLLIFSGLGSYMSGYFVAKRKVMLMIFTAIVVLLFIYSFTLTPVLQQTVHGRLPLKLLIVFLLIAPLAFCMGIPFPAGLLQVSQTNARIIPWAWGLNGCVSVISTALATIIAVEAGFTMVMLLAALAYCLPLLVWSRWK